MGSIGFNTSGQLQVNGIQRSFDVTAPYHLMSGNLALANSVIDSGFATTLYTGNGSTQSVNTGVDMATQWGNLATEKFGGLVWAKSRSTVADNIIYDTVRGVQKFILTNTTGAEADAGTAGVSSFNSNGFTAGNGTAINANTTTYASWVFQTTHRITGTTNHNQSYECHYNPFTGFTMIKYTGSGIAGHEIPHHLGRKLGFVTIKNLSAIVDWISFYNDLYYLSLNTTAAQVASGMSGGVITDNMFNLFNASGNFNASAQNYIMYGWANSYFDEANTLIGNYEIGIYQGTGAVGNKVTTKGKPAWLMVKRLDSTSNWIIIDNKRTVNGRLYPNASAAEDATVLVSSFLSDGFTIEGNFEWNILGGQYLYMVVYDNDSGSGKSKYPRATDTSTLNLNATIPFANGVDSNGTKNSILVKNETVSGLTLTQGKNYVYAKNDGTYGVKAVAPQYGSYSGFGDYFDVNSNKWYNSPSVFMDDFSDGDMSDWTAYSVTMLVINGKAKFTNTTTTVGGISKSFTTVIGKRYKVVGELFASSATPLVNVGINGGGYDILANTQLPAIFVATTTTTHITVHTNSSVSGAFATIDNIAVYPINNDSSVDISGATAITESRNYLDAVVYADQNGQPSYVEQLPKTVYLDEVKANEFKGKNACTAWVNFDGTTTPPTILDSYNVKAVVRTSTGLFDVYFTNPMGNVNYTPLGIPTLGFAYAPQSKSLNKFNMATYNGTVTLTNYADVSVQIFGGKN